ncbi:CheR family methyltransferase [Solicola sp. PLA-1-18]|uniref:CheR family methyltransferase n=1 Tax=Solicola sp. PLA-1-18 TaxID=3380532 RepID=UPI003B7825EC
MSVLTDDDVAYLSSTVTARSGIVLGPDKSYLVSSRMDTLARQIHAPDVQDIVRRVRRGESATIDRVVEAMTTNETSWFRDTRPFEALAATVIPRALQTSNGLRIWSAACSTGQELYSLAMLLDSRFPELKGHRVELLGTDLSQDVVDKAEAGRFSQLEVNRGLPAPMLVRYMDRDGRGYRVRDELRARSTWRTHNLIEPWPTLGTFDIVLMRNVLIYFDIPTKRQILHKVHQVLRPGGHLLLGSAESVIGVTDGFDTEITESTVVYRKTEELTCTR